MTPYHFCKHQKESEVTGTPICSIYGREYECPYVRSYNADYMCKQYVPYRSIGDRLNKVEERLDELECKMEKTLLMVKHVMKGDKQ